MATSKEKMSEYLEKAQTIQRMAMGIVDVSIETTVVKGGESSIKVYVYPLDSECSLIRDEEYKVVNYKYEFREWDTQEANDKQLKGLVSIQKTLLWLWKHLHQSGLS